MKTIYKCLVGFSLFLLLGCNTQFVTTYTQSTSQFSTSLSTLETTASALITTTTISTEPLVYDITYVLGHDDVDNSNNPTSYTCQEEPFSLTNPTLDGFIFTGWTYEEHTIPTKTVMVDSCSIGNLEFIAHWYSSQSIQYSSDNDSVDEYGIIDTFYYIEFYIDETFLLITSNLYETGTIISNAQYGSLFLLGNDIFELDYVDEGIQSSFIFISEDSITFCNEDGTLIDPYSGIERRVDFDATNLDFELYGYGYFDLTSFDHFVGMKLLYVDLLSINDSFRLSEIDFPSESEDYILAELNVTEYGITIEEAIITYKLFMLDHPEIYWMSNSIQISGVFLKVFLEDVYADYSYRSQVDEAISIMISDFDSTINDNMSELEVAKAIHDFIILRVDYAYEEDGTTPQNDYWAHNIEGVALETGAVCEGYAEAFQFLANHVGLASIQVTGTSEDENHQWNLASIEDDYYFVDSTWDDAGGSEISYTYFGMSYSSISATHNLESSYNFGADYLYILPEVSADDITFVTLYEGQQELGLYVSLEKAFLDMIDNDGNYTVELFNYDRTGPILWSTSVRTYSIPSGDMPLVQSIYFKGGSVDLGGGYFTNYSISLDGDIISHSNLIFENITLSAETLSKIDLGSNRIDFKGYHCQLREFIYIFGDESSIITVNVTYEVESYAEIHIGTLDLFYSMLLRGANNTIDTLNLYTNAGYLRVYGKVESVTINNLNVYDPNVVVINLDNIQGTILNIGNIHDESGSEMYRLILVELEDISNMPMINISGQIDCKLQYTFDNTVTYVSTDINGDEIEEWEVSVNLIDFGDGIIMNSPNLDFDRFNIRYSNGYDIKDLYLKDENGNIYRDKDFIEVIEGSKLVRVVSMNDNLTNTYIIPEGISTIGTRAFSSFMHLTELIIPSYVTAIEEYAFIDTRELSFLKIPSSIVTMDANAMVGLSSTILCELLEAPSTWNVEWIYSDSSIVWGYQDSFDNGYFIYATTSFNSVAILKISEENLETDIVIPSSINGLPVTQIVSELFKYNRIITSVFIPSTILEIPSSAFFVCTSLKSVTFEDGSGLQSIGQYAFFQCISLTKIIIPASVSYIGSNAFYNCSLLTIYSSLEQAQATWNPDWNTLPCPVVWNYSEE